MEGVDITGLTEEQVEAVEAGKIPMEKDREGMLRPIPSVRKITIPLPGGKKVKEVQVKATKQNTKLLARFGEKIFTSEGKVNYKAMPIDDLCKKITRRSLRSQMDLFDNLGEKFTKSLLKKVPKTSLKLKSKEKLKNNIRKFLGWKPEKTTSQKSKEKKEKKVKGGKLEKMDVAEGPKNVE